LVRQCRIFNLYGWNFSFFRMSRTMLLGTHISAPVMSDGFLRAGMKLGNHIISGILTYRRAATFEAFGDRSCLCTLLHQFPDCAVCYWFPCRMSGIKLGRRFPLGPSLTTTHSPSVSDIFTCKKNIFTIDYRFLGHPRC
jgi:hypothetical protein